MTYLLEELLTIRKYKEKIAFSQILKVRKEVATAKLKREKSILELISYTNWRENEEKRLIEELMRHPINIYDIEKLNQYMEFLREQQSLLVGKVKKREQEISEAEEKLKEVQRHYADLNRAKQKLQEHKNSWMQEKYLQNERRQDNKQDEFNTNVGFRSSCEPIKL